MGFFKPTRVAHAHCDLFCGVYDPAQAMIEAKTDFFKPHHLEAFPGLHDLFWKALKQASDAKKSMDPAVSEKLVDLIGEVSAVFWQTEESKAAGVYPPA
jgi:nickel superoxide dismutase